MVATEAKKVLKIDEAAAYLRVHPNTIFRMHQNGIYLGSRVGNRWRFRIEDLDRYLADGVSFESAKRGASNEQVKARNARKS